ncbi:tail fiber domain-containing protein [Dyadobacter endophyticus]|uniref:tail fiber domain-containing protein n=1 Tax=Dyadobacter endophyticus TaxID=1749036 RepID=UPI003CF61B39
MKVFLICMMLVLRGLFILAQAPQQFSFQGVARKADGQVAANATISVRTTVHSETAGGTAVYQETHTSQTNTIGIFNIQIGGGTVVSGKFADISWKTFPYFLQLEMDPLGGTTYSDLGTTQMLSVPYAIQAAEATKWNDGFPVVQKDGFGPDIDPNDPDAVNDSDLKKYLLPQIGDGNRLIWYPAKGAFRAGSSISGKWEDSETGAFSAAFGSDNAAKGLASLASGVGSSAIGDFSTGIGYNSFATGYAATSFGIGTQSNHRGSFIVGVYNLPHGSGGSAVAALDDAIFQVGNGTGDNDKANAISVLRNGNTGIKLGNEFPEFPLDVGGRMRIKHNGATSGIYFNNSQNVADGFMGMKTDAQIGFFINGAWRFYVDNAGNGALGGTLTQFSDRRLKRDFSPLSASLRKLAGLKGYHYYWKDQDKDQSLQTGLIAQEVEVLFPELVKTDDKGFKSLNYTGLIPHLIESVKQLAHQNAKLEAENAAFKADSKDIHDQLTMIESRLDKILVQPSGITAR